MHIFLHVKVKDEALRQTLTSRTPVGSFEKQNSVLSQALIPISDKLKSKARQLWT